MRAIRLGLLTIVLLAAANSPARADVIDFHGSGLSNGGANTFSGGCSFGLCGFNLISEEVDEAFGGLALVPGIFDGAIDVAIKATIALIPPPSFDVDRWVFNSEVQAVPEPGTLLLMGLGIAAAGVLQRRRVQAVR
jgi:hypothetical protein